MEEEQHYYATGEEVAGLNGGEEVGSKRTLSGEDDAREGEEEPEQKKRKSGGVSGCSQGILAIKEDGKKYYRCKMSGCVKVRLFF
ncbi:hypothetical protein ACHAXM_003018 [Skeletonema potamos]